MKKFWLLLLWGLLVISNTVLAANISSNEIKDFSTKLDSNKTKLLNSIEASKTKLKSIATEASKFSDTTLFRAASCLGAIPAEDQNLNFEKITTTLKDQILNQYIGLDGDIKRLGFGMSEDDPILFGNKLDNFYNENAIKINSLENEYYLKTNKVKKEFLEYVENNKTLLTKLAQNMDYITTIQTAASGASTALQKFSSAIDARSELMKTIEKSKSDLEKNFEVELENIISQSRIKNQPDNDTQAKYLIHKDNFIKKYKTDINQFQYYIFSAFFPYNEYTELTEKKKDLEKKFLTASGTMNCSLLLTTSLNLGKYAEGVDAQSQKIQKGLTTLTNAITTEKLNLKMIEAPTIEYFKTESNKLTKKLISNFKIMLDAESSTSSEKTQTNQNVNSEITPIQKTTFNQSFNKGQYHEDVKKLQTILKNWGYYQGEISGIYSSATIDAVYKFQLKEGVITGKEKNKAGYGRFGTQTRAKINAMI